MYVQPSYLSVIESGIQKDVVKDGQFAIASDMLWVLSRVPNHLNIEDAHTVSMDVCEYLESCMLFGSVELMSMIERRHTEVGLKTTTDT